MWCMIREQHDGDWKMPVSTVGLEKRREQVLAYATLGPGREHVRADLKPNRLVTKCCPLLPWISGIAAGVLVGPN